MLLHPRLAGGRVTVVGRLVVPLPRRTAGNVGPRVIILRVLATQPRRHRVLSRFHTILSHAFDDAVADAVVQVCAGRVLTGMPLTHGRIDITNVDAGGGGLLRRIRSLRSNDLASNQCTTRGRGNG